MHEGEKLCEAKYFYSKMMEEQGNADNFKHNLSAFLTPARSVLQYALKEAKTKSGGQQWYDNYISASTVLRFFKNQRDFNIHTEPIQPQKHYKLTHTISLSLSESILITNKDKNGKIKQQSSSDELEPTPKEPESPAVLEIRFKFDEWAGSEDILTLCQKYIQEMEDVIKDGVRQGFITG